MIAEALKALKSMSLSSPVLLFLTFIASDDSPTKKEQNETPYAHEVGDLKVTKKYVLFFCTFDFSTSFYRP